MFSQNSSPIVTNPHSAECLEKLKEYSGFIEKQGLEKAFDPYLKAIQSNQLSKSDLDFFINSIKELSEVVNEKKGKVDVSSLNSFFKLKLPHIGLKAEEVTLSQDKALFLFKAYGKKLLLNNEIKENKSNTAISELIDSMDNRGHCNAISSYRSYLIALEKQKNPSLSLIEACNNVKKYEESILNSMYAFVQGEELSKSEQERIENYIRIIVSYQVNAIDYTSGEKEFSENRIIIDTEDRVMDKVPLTSTESQDYNLKDIFSEIESKYPDGDYMLYSAYAQHKTLICISKKDGVFEAMFSDPNASNFVYYDLTQFHAKEELMKRDIAAHSNTAPDWISIRSPYLVTQLSLPNKAIKNQYNKTDLIWYAEHGLAPQIIAELKKPDVDVNSRDQNGMSAFDYCIRNEDASTLALLLEQKISTENLKTALGFAAALSVDDKLFNMLLEKNKSLDLSEISHDGNPLLNLAIHGQQIDGKDANISLLKSLLSLGLDPNQVNSRGMNALMFAAQNPEALDLLLSATKKMDLKMDLDMVDQRGFTVTMYATQATLEDVGLKSLQLLFDQTPPPNLNKKDNSGITALMHAAQAGNPEIVNFLIQKGADQSLTDDRGRTFLDYKPLTFASSSVPSSPTALSIDTEEPSFEEGTLHSPGPAVHSPGPTVYSPGPAVHSPGPAVHSPGPMDSTLNPSERTESAIYTPTSSPLGNNSLFAQSPKDNKSKTPTPTQQQEQEAEQSETPRRFFFPTSKSK